MLLGADIEIAKANISSETAKMTKKEAYGVAKPSDWSDILCKYLIVDMFNCSGGNSLDKCDKDCLKGKLSMGLTNNCC